MKCNNHIRKSDIHQENEKKKNFLRGLNPEKKVPY